MKLQRNVKKKANINTRNRLYDVSLPFVGTRPRPSIDISASESDAWKSWEYAGPSNTRFLRLEPHFESHHM